MCGIMGYAGKDLSRFSSYKFNSLGVWNEKRGEHSCGVASDGEIFIGVNKEKVFRDFVVNTGYKEPSLLPVVIGHTRHATGGAHTVENAHPFGFGDNKGESFAFIGVHNGTLVNHSELAREYGIDTFVSKETPGKRSKIDSEILLEIVYKHGFEVLSKYNGAAALVWTRPEEPNIMYVYRGKSSPSRHDKIKTEERPMFYLQESKNSLYISSIEDSLSFINEDESIEIKEFDCNTVYKITDGDVANAVKFAVDREDNFQKSYTPYSGNYNYSRNTSRYSHMTPTKKEKKKDKKKFTENKRNFNFKKADGLLNLVNEEVKEDTKMLGKLYYNKLRYWKNGALITGIWALLKNDLFYYLGDTESEAERRYNTVSKKMKFTTGKDAFLYFYNGIFLKTPLDYTTCMISSINFDLLQLSYVSRYPIINLKLKNPTAFLDGKLATETYLPLNGTTIYDIVAGKMIKYITKGDDNSQYILGVDQPLLDIQLIEDDPDVIKEEEISAVAQYKDEILSAIDVCDVDVEEDITNKDLLVSIKETLKEVKEFTKEKLEKCLKKIQG